MQWRQGSQVVTASGTRESLTADAGGGSVKCLQVEIQAKKVSGDNTGNVFVGDSDLVAGSAEGIELTPGDGLTLLGHGKLFDLADIYVDADTNGDGVVFLYIQ